MRAEIKEAIRQMACEEEAIDVRQVDNFRIVLARKLAPYFIGNVAQKLAGVVLIEEYTKDDHYTPAELEALATAFAKILYKRYMHLQQVFDDPIKMVFAFTRPKFVL